MRRGIDRHVRSIADARSQRIRSAEAITADRLSAPPDDAPGWMRALESATAIAAPFLAAADRRKAQRIAVAMLVAVAPLLDEAHRHAVALLVAVDRSRDDSPPTGVLAVAALCSAPRPGPLAALAA